MTILLDTHILIWWDSEANRLSASARSLCEDAGNILVVSVASVWEMQIKQQLGELHLRKPLVELIQEQRERNGIQILPVELAHVLALSQLEPHHKDPFDRLLIAQARSEGFPILTADNIFEKYPVQILG